MKLREYMQERGWKDADLAQRIGVSVQAANRYRRGLRIPSGKVMRRIAEVTGGAVTANDFYDAAPARAEVDQ